MGPQPSPEELAERYGADSVHSPREISDVLAKYNAHKVHSLQDMECPTDYDFGQLRTALNNQRRIKSPEEIAVMEAAHAVTKEAHYRIMATVQPGVTENGIRKEVIGIFIENGADYCYPPTITTEGNILHNRSYKNTLRTGNLLLVDAGAEIDCLGSDITRTYPVSGTFTPEQADLYDIVLKAQQEAITMIRPGLNYSAAHGQAERIITGGLRDMGLIYGSIDSLLENKVDKLFFPHALGHYLGLDVHDPEKRLTLREAFMWLDLTARPRSRNSGFSHWSLVPL